MTLDITVTDLFCGAGGSSIGAEASGARLVMAANHWRLAIETHNSNFPNADHDCADVSQVNPRRYPRTDILIASPECTNHSQAKAHKVRSTIWEPNADLAEERSRATMWDVPRFAEHHRYRYVIVENVVDARYWVAWDAWLSAMTAMEYEHEVVYLNSMHAGSPAAAPAPQSRDRMYVVFWRTGNPAPDLRLPAGRLVHHLRGRRRGGPELEASRATVGPLSGAVRLPLPAVRVAGPPLRLARRGRHRLEPAGTAHRRSRPTTR